MKSTYKIIYFQLSQILLESSNIILTIDFYLYEIIVIIIVLNK